MTVERARRILTGVILVALAVGAVGSLALVVFAERLSRFPTMWG